MVRAAAMAPFSTTRRNSRLSCSSMHPPKSYVNLVGPLAVPPRLPPAMVRCCAAALGRHAMLDQTRLGVDTACVFFENPTQISSVRYYAGDEITTLFTFLVNFV